MAVIAADRVGDFADRLIARCAEADIEPGRVHIIDPLDPSWTMPWNPFSGPGDPNSIAGAFVSGVRRNAASWGIQLEESLRCFSLALVLTGHSPLEIDALFSNAEFRASVADQIQDAYLRGFFERFEGLSSDAKRQWHLAVANKLAAFLSVPQLRRMLCASGRLDLRAIIDDPKAILVAVLRSDQLHDGGDILGGLLVRGIWNAVLSRADLPEQDRQSSVLILDEFQNFGQDVISEIIAEGRRYALRLVIAHQSQCQVQDGLRALIRNNAAVRLVFSPGPIDAQELAKELTPMPSSDAYAALMRLGVGQAYVIRRGQRAVKVQTPNVAPLRVSAAKVAAFRQEAMRLNARPIVDVDSEIDDRIAGIAAMSAAGITTSKEVRHVRKPSPKANS